jgi:hypothetical protein
MSQFMHQTRRFDTEDNYIYAYVLKNKGQSSICETRNSLVESTNTAYIRIGIVIEHPIGH